MDEAAGRRERERLSALRDCAVLDTAPEPAFDDLVYLAAQICAAPMALLTFVQRERQWFKSRIGILEKEWPREDGFCPVVVDAGAPLVLPDLAAIPDARADRLAARGLIVRSYHGAPLRISGGHILGALAVLDHVPRRLEAWQMDALRLLAEMAAREIETRRSKREMERRRLDTIGALTGGLAQEFNQLLREILSHAGAVAGRPDQDETLRTGLQRIVARAERAAGITRQMLRLGRHETPAPQRFDVNELLLRREREWQAILGEAGSVRLRLDPGLEQARADPDQIARAVAYLVEQVRDSVPRGERLTIRTSRWEPAEGHASPGPAASGWNPDPPEDCVVVSVESESLEMSAGAEEETFALPDLIRDDPGAGPFSLALATGIVSAGGGRLLASERKEAGRRYRILLPSGPRI